MTTPRLTPERLEWERLTLTPIDESACMLTNADVADIRTAIAGERHLVGEPANRLWQKIDILVGTLRQWNTSVPLMIAELDAVTAERDEARGDAKRKEAIIERERTWANEWITRVRAEIRKRRGISQSRGSYEWDDDEYMKEFGWALDAIESALDKATRDTNCRDLSDCPTTQAEVDAARAGLFPSPAPTALAAEAGRE